MQREENLDLRVNNALVLALIMKVDITEPVGAQKVLRRLSSVEKYVAQYLGDADA